MQNLLDGHGDKDDIYDVLEEPKDNKKLFFVTFIVAIIAILAFSLYYFISAAPQKQAGERRQALQNVPLLKPAGALKKIPENAGGLNIPHQDKKVFETIEPSPQTEPSPSPSPEPSPPTNDDTTTVLPPPETPVAPEPTTQPAAPSPSAEPSPQDSAEPAEASPEPSPEPAGRLQIDIFAPPSPSPQDPAQDSSVAAPSADNQPSPESSPSSEEENDKLEIIIPSSPEPSPSPSPEPSPSETEEQQQQGQQGEQGEEQGGEQGEEQGGGFTVQFAALANAASAQVIRTDILQRFSDILPADRLPDGLAVVMDKLADGSDIFRVQMENLDYDTAQQICRRAQQDNQDCFVKRN